MSVDCQFIPIRCHACDEALVRVTDAHGDHVICPSCHAYGNYQVVIEHGAGRMTARPDNPSVDLKALVAYARRKMGLK